MPDYANGKIYKIVCNITGEQYIGATIQKLLSQRLTQHVRIKKTGQKCKSIDIISRGDYQIVLIENYPCNNKEELAKKEREHIESNICVNKNIPSRTPKEWRDTHKEAISLYHKENYITNKEAIDLRNKEYMNNHKEEMSLLGKKYYNDHKNKIALKHKEYRGTHKEEVAMKNKEYRDSHKEIIALKNKEYREKNKEELNRKSRERYQKKKQEKMEAVDPII